MNQEIKPLALKKIRDLSETFDGFINVILDDWRGYRFIYDVEESSCCKYGCNNCPLYKLLKDEKDGLFTAGLLPASSEDKLIFGPQNFLNLRSIEQYQNCYINFLVKKCFTRKEIFDELDLVNNMSVIFSRDCSAKEQEINFKNNVITHSIAMSDAKTAKIIQEYLNLNPWFFDFTE